MIGVFDSGIGGLTVAKKIWDILGPLKIIYFGDTARVPYGNRGNEVIRKYTNEGINFLLRKGAKIIIIACHTASAICQEEFKNFNLPIFDVVKPTVKAAVANVREKNKRIGIIGTRATVNSRIYEKLIKKECPSCQVFSRPAPLLVPLIEEGWMKKVETKRILKKYLKPLKNQRISVLVLGCTHYPLIKNLVEIKIGKQTKIIDPGEEVAKNLQEFLKNHPKIREELPYGNSQFYFSDIGNYYPQIIERFLGKKVKCQRWDSNPQAF